MFFDIGCRLILVNNIVFQLEKLKNGAALIKRMKNFFENDAVNNDKMDLSFLWIPCQDFSYDCAAILAVDSVCRFGMLRWTMENQYIITAF